ncbi:MAG: transcription termination factor Rho [Chloroflexota bacterium]|nr:transcription termination factor Rho [Chloroflexota bacterium]
MATPKPKSTKKTTTKTKKDAETKEPSVSTSDVGILKRHGVDDMSVDEVVKFAEKSGVSYLPDSDMNDRVSVVLPVLSHFAQEEDLLLGFGILDILSDGYGFLRNPDTEDNKDDIYVSQSQVRRFSLRKGDKVAGQVRQPKEKERYYGLTKVEMVNGYDPESSQMKQRPNFEKLTPIYPNERLTLETGNKPFSSRLIDIFSPIGKGQRALIVAPPKAGKTILLKEIARGISENHPEVELFVALIGERPEEVTDMVRSVSGKVFSSTFDEPVEDHCKTAERSMVEAKRAVESGKDVVVLLDSLTRLARAHNLNTQSSGRTLSGGMDPLALYPPKQFFGAARNFEELGSLTIIATCLVDTGSRLDDLIYEEFKGTGNMELHLDRRLSEQRVWPAIEISKSGTRNEANLLDEFTMKQVTLLRRMIALSNSHSDASSDPTALTQKILNAMGKTATNKEFLKVESWIKD